MSTRDCRKIMVMSQQKSRPTVFTVGCNTWGELKEVMSREFNDIDKMRATIRENRNDLNSDAAILPEGDFSIYLTPKKMKAGQDQVDTVKLLKSLRSKWVQAIDELIDEAEDGSLDVEDDNDYRDDCEEQTSLTREDKNLLEELRRENAG